MVFPPFPPPDFVEKEPFLALFRKKLSRSSQVNVERRWDCFAPALSLQTLQVVHSAIELPVQVSFVAEKFVRGIRGRQAETSSLRVSHELLALCRVSLKRAKPLKLTVNKCGDDVGAFLVSLRVLNAVRWLAVHFGFWRTGVETRMGEEGVRKAIRRINPLPNRFRHMTVAGELGLCHL